jgi:hypothetical protein
MSDIADIEIDVDAHLCSTDMPQGHATWTCSNDMQQGYAVETAKTSSMDMRHVRASCPGCSEALKIRSAHDNLFNDLDRKSAYFLLVR